MTATLTFHRLQYQHVCRNCSGCEYDLRYKLSLNYATELVVWVVVYLSLKVKRSCTNSGQAHLKIRHQQRLTL